MELFNRNQFFAGFLVNLSFLSQGCIVGWVSPAITHLTSNSTNHSNGPLTVEQISWIGSIAPLGSVFGCLATGLMTSLLGNKISTLLLAIPALSFWMIIMFSDLYIPLLIARFISGCAAGGLSITVPLFIAEISDIQ